jgi:hypothetical protein
MRPVAMAVNMIDDVIAALDAIPRWYQLALVHNDPGREFYGFTVTDCPA